MKKSSKKATNLNNKYEHIDLFINYLERKRKAENTISSYKTDLYMFYDFLLEKHDFKEINLQYLNEIKLNELDEFLSYSKDNKEIASSTQGRRKSSLQAYFKYLVEYDYIENDATEKLKAPKIEKRQPVYMTLNESTQLLNVIDDLRDKTIITLFLHCGMRLSELISININHVNFETNTMKIIGKGNKERTIYLNSSCVKILNEYLELRMSYQDEIKSKDIDSKNALFLTKYLKRITKISIERMLDKYIKKAELGKHITPHKLRHTSATLMIKGNVNIKSIQKILGHSSLLTTQIYTHVDDEQLHEAVQSNPLNHVI